MSIPTPTPRPVVKIPATAIALALTWAWLGWSYLGPSLRAVELPHVFCWSPCERCLGGTRPKPPPPGPTPPPVTTPLHATLIYDAGNQAEALASEPTRGDPKLSDALAALGC